MTRNPVQKLILILIVLGLCGWLIYAKGLRYGKDLQGGVSLVYAVNFSEGTTSAQKIEIIKQTISILKERVNPSGLLDISMQPMGTDRIEIVMPLMGAEGKALKAKFEDALAELTAAAEIPEDKLDESLRSHTALKDLGGPEGSERAARVEGLQKTFDEIQEAQAAVEKAKAENAAEDVIGLAEQAVARGEVKYDQQRAAVLRMSLDQTRITRTIALSTKREAETDAQRNTVIDATTGKTKLRPSQRDAAVAILKTEYPHLSSALDKVIATYDEYNANRKGLDDPEDLIRLLQGAGVLDFHIAVNIAHPEGVNIDDMKRELKEKGPDRTDSPVAKWFLINDLKQWYEKPEQLQMLQKDPSAYFSQYLGPRGGFAVAEYDAQLYMLLYTSPGKAMTHSADSSWSVLATYLTNDQFGLPAVAFRLDSAGGLLMGRLTGAHVQEPMAIVLDGQVYSAPNLNSRIDANGVIEGKFSQPEIDYLVRVLASGALEARLSPNPISIYTIGPTIGKENLNKGLYACLISIIAVAIFMVVYYFFAGLIADVAVLGNAVFIFGVMALMDGTFTLPGLAGIALTIGTAVDANILIYERIREELMHTKEDLRTAIRLGYEKALSTIVDSNVTNLIACVVLIFTATTEVKGFAMTLTIGIIGTLFTALFVTKVLFTILLDHFGMKRMPLLATQVPAVAKMLEPNFNWIGKRWYLAVLSITLVTGSWVLISIRGVSLLDTEFRGGVAATMRTAKSAEDQSGKQLAQADVEDRIHHLGELAQQQIQNGEKTHDLQVQALLSDADVLTVGETGTDSQHRLTADGFQIKIAVPDELGKDATTKNIIVDAIAAEFKDDLAIAPALTFDGAGSADHEKHTFPLNANTLGKAIGRPEITNSVAKFQGGVAVVLNNITPAISIQDAEDRIATMRKQPDFNDCNGREVSVIGLDRAPDSGGQQLFSSMAVLVSDPQLNFLKVDFDRWDKELAAREWELVSEALHRPASLDQVSEFSSAVAQTLRANAIVAVTLTLFAILVYIWVRFGSLRYSTGAILALFHDCSIALGALALSQLISQTVIGKALLLESFQIDLGVVAAILTLIGYSLNDTIVVLDRIRENRGKRKFPTAAMVNKAINDTFSRTLLTSFTIIVSLLIMYVEGGTGIRAFSFCMLVGMIVGTYSSIAIAAPIVYKDETHLEGHGHGHEPVRIPSQIQTPQPSA